MRGVRSGEVREARGCVSVARTRIVRRCLGQIHQATAVVVIGCVHQPRGIRGHEIGRLLRSAPAKGVRVQRVRMTSHKARRKHELHASPRGRQCTRIRQDLGASPRSPLSLGTLAVPGNWWYCSRYGCTPTRPGSSSCNCCQRRSRLPSASSRTTRSRSWRQRARCSPAPPSTR